MRLVGFLCAVPILSVINAVILRAACRAFNKLAGNRDPITALPEPDFGRAFGIAFISSIVMIAVDVVLDVGAGHLRSQGTPVSGAVIVAGYLLGMVFSLLAFTVILTGMLPTRYSRACLVTLLYLGIGLLVAAVVGAIVAGLIAWMFHTGMMR